MKHLSKTNFRQIPTGSLLPVENTVGIRQQQQVVSKTQTYTLTLEALPSPIPVEVRLRHFLRRAWRDWKIKCTAISPSKES